MAAAARGAVSPARMPVRARSSGPSTRRQRQPVSQRAPAGASVSGQTTESSSAVRVTEKRPDAAGMGGTGAPAGRRQTA